MTANNNMTKPIKWATQRGNILNTTKATYRIRKKSSNSNQTRRAPLASLFKEEDDLVKLEKELAFTHDTIATITVHYESLYHAYHSSKSKLDQNKSGTRLCEMEKELLTAYDDLSLQVNHLERKITQLEKEMKQVQVEETLTVSSPYSSSDSDTSLSNQGTPYIHSIQHYDTVCYEQPLFEQQNDMLYNYYAPVLFM